ncbi:NAD(P)-dependent dehydrogenase, short-chain alcohol dehydrogenase family [Methylobacterium sp. ap11]|uniref:SDR family NAD(P)-dependent oxidoreductase n=1 Tax=Methylobacterium sp. ap11 TaxID=1761799 RepID=UPI0008D1DF1C|nr:SDR family NAD(P)-dependent oxidoreductase [Methylobacterium sp. ap11]SEP28522.1 NAD(P)-dependent dehydrogenase, short-chain alcohol dehydrogenase family [Methylobacterium sp. ap11]
MTDRPLFGEGAAFVIGGSGGVGQAICQALAEAGANVALTYRSNEEKARGVVRAIEGQGRRAAALALDLTDRAGTAAAVARVASEFEGIHSLVLATGADISMSYTAEIDPDEWDRTIAGDLTGSFNVLRAAIPHLRAARGAVVAITSAGLVRHPPKDILSVVPKAGIEAMMRGIAREEGRWGVRANAIALGVIDTGLFHRLEQRLSPDFVEAMRRNTALRRFGTADEVADLAVFLASARSGFITGQSIALDGGYSV